MLVWASEFPIRSEYHCKAVLALAKEWLIGSPHSTWTESLLSPNPVDDIVEIVNDGQTVQIASFEKGSSIWCGFRHLWSDAGVREWITEIVAHKTASSLWVSIQVNCHLLAADLALPTPKKPYIVRQLLERFGGGLDGTLPISDKPTYLEETDIQRAVTLLSGSAGNRLPIVFASSTWQGGAIIDANALAKWLSGMAHVIVEPSREFSFKLAELVDGSNAYNGAVGIYWPGGTAKQFILLADRYDSPIRVAAKAADLVRKALTCQRPFVDCTWGYIREQITKSRVEALKASGSTELNKYIEAFDAEITAKDARIEAAEQEINRLSYELKNLDAGLKQQSFAGLLEYGEEKNLYPGEIKDAVLLGLKIASDHLYEKGRCKDIVDDILKSKSASGMHGKIESSIKDTLNGVSDIGKSEIVAIERIGFSVSSDTKHIKLLYRQDPRYAFTVSKTGSDWRAMKNLVSGMTKTILK